MEKEKVSIIIPVYNSESTLKRCIESVINQTYKNIEILIINDGSKDKSLNIMNEYKNKDERIIVINQKNKGLSGARNTGVNNATGDYITFIDSDDYIKPNLVKDTIKIFEEYECDVVRNNYELSYENGKTELRNEMYEENRIINIEEKKEELIQNILLGKVQSYSWLLTIKREILDKNNLKFDEDIFFMEDIVFIIRLIFCIKNIYFVREPNYFYYQSNENSLTKDTKKYVKNINNILVMKKRLEKILKMHINEFENYIKIINTVYLNGIIGYLKISVRNSGNYKEILDELKKIRESQDIKEMLGNKSLKLLKLNSSLYIYLYEKKKYNTLIKIFKLENLLKRRK